MSPSLVSSAVNVAAPVIKRATPMVSELFRHGALYQPAPPDQVAEHLRRYRENRRHHQLEAVSAASTTAATTNQYKGFYVPNTLPSAALCSGTDPRILDTGRTQYCINGSENTRNPVYESSSATISHDLNRDGAVAGLQHHYDQQQQNADLYAIDEEVQRRRRRLTILFTWLGAKEKYAHKYIGLWTQRGNAVLHITCSIRDLLRPKTGAEETAARVRDHISSLDGWRVLVHGLSVGGYITQHVLKGNEDSVTNKLSHQIYDSFTNVEGLAEGVENAAPARFSGVAKKVGQMYMRYADMSSFNESRNHILNGKAISPIFIMHSMADRVAQYNITLPLVEAMQRKTTVDTFLVPEQMKIPHVGLLRIMGPPSYMDTIETFLDHHPDHVE